MIVQTENVEVLGILEKFAGDEATAVEALLDTFPAVGNIQSMQRRIERMKKSKPKKAKTSREYQDWLESPFISFCTSSFAGGSAENIFSTTPEVSKSKGRPGKRLSESPCADTIKNTMAPEIDRLKTFAEQQGVAFEHVINLLTPEHSKKPNVKCTIPKNEALALFFNAGFSSRGWTELRLFLLRFGVELPTRNEIDNEKKCCTQQ